MNKKGKEVGKKHAAATSLNLTSGFVFSFSRDEILF